MQLTSLLSALALVLGTGAVWANSAANSSTAPEATNGSSDLAALVFPSNVAAAVGSSMAISLSGGLSLSNIRITVLDATPTAALAATPEQVVLLDQALMAGAGYFFQVRGSPVPLASGLDVDPLPTSPVPEPATAALMLSGLAALWLGTRRRARR